MRLYSIKILYTIGKKCAYIGNEKVRCNEKLSLKKHAYIGNEKSTLTNSPETNRLRTRINLLETPFLDPSSLNFSTSRRTRNMELAAVAVWAREMAPFRAARLLNSYAACGGVGSKFCTPLG